MYLTFKSRGHFDVSNTPAVDVGFKWKSSSCCISCARNMSTIKERYNQHTCICTICKLCMTEWLKVNTDDRLLHCNSLSQGLVLLTVVQNRYTNYTLMVLLALAYWLKLSKSCQSFIISQVATVWQIEVLQIP